MQTDLGSLATTEIGPELVAEGSINDQTLRQGINRLNQGHGCLGSESSGRARACVVKAHSRLGQGSGTSG